MKRHYFQDDDLNGFDFSHRDMRGSSFSENVANANFRYTNLAKTWFVDSNLTGADLTGANLTKATLRGADLRGAILTDTIFHWTEYDEETQFDPDVLLCWPRFYRYGPNQNLTGLSARAAFLYEMDLSGTVFQTADLWGVSLERTNLCGSNLNFCDIRYGNLVGANLTSATLKGARLEGANLRGANLTGVDLANVNLRKTFYEESTIWPQGVDPAKTGAIKIEPAADLRNLNLPYSYLADSDLRDADLSGAKLRNSCLFGANLQGANLSQTNLKGVVYDKETQWPNGFDPVVAGALLRP